MRIYKRNGKKYASVTSILGMMHPFDNTGFEIWATANGYDSEWITNESNRIGTLVHSWCENAIKGIWDWADFVPTSDKEMGYYESVHKFSKDYIKPEVENKSEFEVYCDEYRYAGRCDSQIGDTMLDFKTFGAWKGVYKEDKEKIKKTAMQLSMYAYPDKVANIAVVLFKPSGEYELRPLEKTDKWRGWIDENKDKLDEILK